MVYPPTRTDNSKFSLPLHHPELRMRLVRSSRYLASVLVPAAGLFFAVHSAAAQGGTITGKITAAGTGEPLAEAVVLVVGTNARTNASQDGTYRLTNVRAANVDVQVLHVGFATQKKTIFVTAGAALTLDFQLQQAVVKLQEMVTTATGQQRKVELGNALATISASKLAEEAPVRTMTDLLTARAPSVSITPGNYTGQAAQIRIRGLSSISNSGPPLYIVAGIRLTASN